MTHEIAQITDQNVGGWVYLNRKAEPPYLASEAILKLFERDLLVFDVA